MTTITNWGQAMLASLIGALAGIVAFLPRLVGFIVILLVGWIIAAAIEKGVVWLLHRVNLHGVAARTGLTNMEQRMNMRMDVVKILGKIVFWFVFLIFIVPAVDALGLTTVSNLLNTIIGYLPDVFVAVLVLFLGLVLGNFCANLVHGLISDTRLGNPNIFANITRYAIIGFAVLIALYQLQIAPALITTLFTAIVGAMALAFGLAFGLGGRESAQRWLQRGETNLSNSAAQMNVQRAQQATQQNISQARTMADQQAANQPRIYGGDQPIAGGMQAAASTPTDEQLRNPKRPLP